MKISGIICEYNPFHNGHIYHIDQTRRNGATHIAAVMSGNFVQRGDAAVMDKFERARLAVRSGADLVIELPVQYCLSSAENFAAGAVHLLDSLGVVDELSFGSECGDIGKLDTALDMILSASESHSDEIHEIMEKGYTYPRALSSVINGIDPRIGAVITQPNNLLAIEYIKALRNSGSDMKPFTVRRESADHDSDVPADEFASASYIRKKLDEKNGLSEVRKYLPFMWADSIAEAIRTGKKASLSRLERVILYKIRTASVEEIASVSDVAQGLEYRIASAKMASTLDELLFTIKNKRYTMARIRRVILSLLIGITKNDMRELPPYGRILAFNNRGREILALSKEKAKIPFAVSIAKLSGASAAAKRFAELEIRASDVYGLALGSIDSAQKDYRAKIMIDVE